MDPPALPVFPLAMPATPGFKEVIWGMDSVVAIAENPFSFVQQAHAWHGQRWKCGLRLPPMRRDLALAWWAFFAALNGQEGTFLLTDSAFARKQITDSLGNPETIGAQPPGRSITTQGWLPYRQVVQAGDWIGVAGRLRRVLAPAYSDAAGQASIVIWPNMAATSASSSIEWLAPNGVFRLGAEIETTWDINRMMSGIQFSAVEVLT